MHCVINGAGFLADVGYCLCPEHSKFSYIAEDRNTGLTWGSYFSGLVTTQMVAADAVHKRLVVLRGLSTSAFSLPQI